MKHFDIRRTLGCTALVLMTALTSCSSDDLSSTSVINPQETRQNDFDKWLDINYVSAYNIKFEYRYSAKESDVNYATVPVKYDEAIVMAHLVKYLCLETYDEVAGANFTRANFPKMIYLIGEYEFMSNGDKIAGQAEKGKKILLSGVNYVSENKNNAKNMNDLYFHTIHHEFCHILNQTKPYSASFQKITGSDYVAGMWSSEVYTVNYLSRGFISAYAQQSESEDFAEMLSYYVTNTPEQWEAWMKEAGQEGKSKILAKLNIVSNYMKVSWGINIDQLRDGLLRRESDVVNGKVNLTDLTIE